VEAIAPDMKTSETEVKPLNAYWLPSQITTAQAQHFLEHKTQAKSSPSAQLSSSDINRLADRFVGPCFSRFSTMQSKAWGSDSQRE
jgi:hypothetical protein